MIFSYTAIDSQGKKRQATLNAPTQSDAQQQLKQNGFFSIRLTPLPAAAKPAFKLNPTIPRLRPISALTLFTRQLAVLTGAGVPLLRSLRLMEGEKHHPTVQRVLPQLAQSIENGQTLSESFAQYPRLFDPLYINLVKAGESSGTLHTSLERLAVFLEKSRRLQAKVITALIYPAMILGLALGILGLLITFIIPRFKIIFRNLLGHETLPPLTQFILQTSEWISLHISWITGFTAGGLILWKILTLAPAIAILWDKAKLRLPVAGALLTRIASARFTRTLGTLLSSGVPFLQSLDMARDTAGNRAFAQAVDGIHHAVKEGESMAMAMKGLNVFPPMVSGLVQIGEETGELPEMLGKIADIYEEEIDTTVASMTALLEPIMILLLAGIVGIIIFALFMPLISLISQLSG